MDAPWLAQRERGSRSAMRLMKWLALRCGRRVARLLLFPICAYFLLFSPRARATSREYLTRVLGRQPRLRDLWRHYFTFAATVLDRVYLLGGRFECFDIEMKGLEALQGTLAAGRGCLLLGAHLGSFEVLRVPINVVMYEDNAANITEVLNSLQPEMRSRVIVPGQVDTVLRIGECLARGEIVGVLGDRCAGSDKSVVCPFLGRNTAFPQGPLLLAQSLRVPVVLFFGVYEGGARYVVHFEPFCDDYPADRTERTAWIERWTRRYAVRLEYHCRLAPYNWFNFYDFWSGPPA
jgi:predicted LPLAT superfamily acyltransferase